jgi:hypothetical protein
MAEQWQGGRLEAGASQPSEIGKGNISQLPAELVDVATP